MGRISEALVRFILRERYLQRIEREAARGKAVIIDVSLRKGVEYVLRGSVAKCHGALTLSLRDVMGFEVPAQYYSNDGKCLSVIPEADGLYRIHAVVKAGTDRESATITVTLSCSVPVAPHILRKIVTPAYWLTDDRPAAIRIPEVERQASNNMRTPNDSPAIPGNQPGRPSDTQQIRLP